MATTIRVSIRLTNYSADEFVTDIFGVLRGLYRLAHSICQLVVALSRFAVALVKKVLIGILLAEIVGFTLIFLTMVIIAVFALFTSS